MTKRFSLNRDPSFYRRQDFRMIGFSILVVLGPWALFPVLDPIGISFIALNMGMFVGVAIAFCGVAASLGKWGLHSRKYTILMIAIFTGLAAVEIALTSWGQWYWAMERGYFLD